MCRLATTAKQKREVLGVGSIGVEKDLLTKLSAYNEQAYAALEALRRADADAVALHNRKSRQLQAAQPPLTTKNFPGKMRLPPLHHPQRILQIVIARNDDFITEHIQGIQYRDSLRLIYSIIPLKEISGIRLYRLGISANSRSKTGKFIQISMQIRSYNKKDLSAAERTPQREAQKKRFYHAPHGTEIHACASA